MPVSASYVYPDAGPRWNDDYIWRPVEGLLRRFSQPGQRVLEIGCGNGVAAARMRDMGLRVTAIDPSESGVAVARAAYPGVEFSCASVEDALAERFGSFPLIVSFEVLEHCYSPRRFVEAAFEALDHNGTLVLSTPYHGYIKNLVLALSGKLDAHFTALWEGGHIKFFSERTIRTLLEHAGFRDIQVARIGRIPSLAKSMLVTARKG